MAEWNRAPHKSLYRPSTSDSATTISPSESQQPRCIEPLHTDGQPDVTNAGPERKKRRERDLPQRPGIATKQLKNSLEGQALESKGKYLG